MTFMYICSVILESSLKRSKFVHKPKERSVDPIRSWYPLLLPLRNKILEQFPGSIQRERNLTFLRNFIHSSFRKSGSVSRTVAVLSLRYPIHIPFDPSYLITTALDKTYLDVVGSMKLALSIRSTSALTNSLPSRSVSY